LQLNQLTKASYCHSSSQPPFFFIDCDPQVQKQTVNV